MCFLYVAFTFLHSMKTTMNELRKTSTVAVCIPLSQYLTAVIRKHLITTTSSIPRHEMEGETS